MIISTLAHINGRDYYASAEVVGDPGLGVMDVIAVVRHGRKIKRHHRDYGAVCKALYSELDRQMRNKVVRGIALYQLQQEQQPCGQQRVF